MSLMSTTVRERKRERETDNKMIEIVQEFVLSFWTISLSQSIDTNTYGSVSFLFAFRCASYATKATQSETERSEHA